MIGEEAAKSNSEIEPQEAQRIIDTQVQIMRRLNDELLRTVRLHALLGGGVITVVSIFGSDSLFWGETTVPSLIAWGIPTVIATFMGASWIGYMVSARVSYSELQLGIQPEGSKRRMERPNLRLRDSLLSLRGTLQTDSFENQLDKDEAASAMLAEDYTNSVRHNNWIIVTREAYVNSIQKLLNLTFLITILSLTLILLP